MGFLVSFCLNKILSRGPILGFKARLVIRVLITLVLDLDTGPESWFRLRVRIRPKMAFTVTNCQAQYSFGLEQDEGSKWPLQFSRQLGPARSGPQRDECPKWSSKLSKYAGPTQSGLKQGECPKWPSRFSQVLLVFVLSTFKKNAQI